MGTRVAKAGPLHNTRIEAVRYVTARVSIDNTSESASMDHRDDCEGKTDFAACTVTLNPLPCNDLECGQSRNREIHMMVVTTPTGTIGRQVLKNLFESSEQIRVTVRDPYRLTAREQEHVEVVQGSHKDVDVVNEAFEGADSVFWFVPPDPRANSVEAAYVEFTKPARDALTSQAVRRVVVVSALVRGTPVAENTGLVTGSLAMDDLIATAGVDSRTLTMPSFRSEPLSVRTIAGGGGGATAAILDRCCNQRVGVG